MQETALGARRRPAPDFCQDSHACDLGELLNKARARPAPDPVRPAPVSPARARAYKATEASTVLPRMLSTSPEPKITGVCPANGVPAATRSPPPTVDRPTEPFPAAPDPWS
jgi:hypothetical protein